MQDKKLLHIQHLQQNDTQGQQFPGFSLDWNFQSYFPIVLNSQPQFQNDTKLIAQNELSQKDSASKQPKMSMLQNHKSKAHQSSSIPSLKHKRKNNQDRNNIPNLLNPLVTILTHFSKHNQYIRPIFQKIDLEWKSHSKIFCQYMKSIKSTCPRSLSQKFLQKFSIIHCPNFTIYSKDQQELYMKIARIFILDFLNNQSMINVLRSRKMKKQNKGGHVKSIGYLKRTFINFCTKNTT